MKYEKLQYGGWDNCIRIYNDSIELIVSTDIGPRILHLGFIGGQNFFHLSPDDAGKTGGPDWRLYGGHRFWLAPEAIPFSYYPDNETVGYEVNGNTLLFVQPVETISGLAKEIEITLLPGSNEVYVLHRIINKGAAQFELAPWALSALAPNGRAIIPQEPYGAGNDFLLPARSLALWHYTTMNDPRWKWGKKYIQAKQDPALATEQKIGLLNKQGWIAYALHGELLIKKFAYEPNAVYPDYGSNNETYISQGFLEVETLGPLVTLPPGASAEHKETWHLCRVEVSDNEASIDTNILPLLDAIKFVA